MKVARHCGPEQDHALDVGASCSPNPLHKFVDCMNGYHRVLGKLPTAAGAATAGTSSAKSAETSTASEPSATPTTGPAATSTPAASPSSKHVREENPPEYVSQRRE